MMQLDFGPSSRRVWMWRGTLPDARYEPISVFSVRVPAAVVASAAPNQAATELRQITGPRSHYGLLGAEFVPNGTAELTIEVATSGEDGPGEEGTRWVRPGATRWTGEYVGLPNEYGQAVLEGVRDAPGAAQLGGGTLRFDRAAHHVVDSNPFTYRRLAQIVVRLLLPSGQALTESNLVDLVREAMRQ